MTVVTSDLPTPLDQADRLVALGIHEIAGIAPAELCASAGRVRHGELLVLHPDRAPASALAPLLERAGKPGFVVLDMTDVDGFTPIEEVSLPAAPVYGVAGLDRGDAMANRGPDEALPAIAAAGRTPLVLTEGIHWLLQRPDVLERNHCFMTIGSRLRRQDGRLDTRTPAIWISNGTGRDGRERRDAPKIGWCWAGNRHTWLGCAAAGRAAA